MWLFMFYTVRLPSSVPKAGGCCGCCCSGAVTCHCYGGKENGYFLNKQMIIGFICSVSQLSMRYNGNAKNYA